MITNALISTVAMLELYLNQIVPFEIAEPVYVQEKIYYDNPVLEIPKINLKKEIYPNDVSKNNVDKNIQVIDGSSMPNVGGGNLILASHSGNSDIAYFKHLDELSYNDEFFIYYKNIKYRYIIGDIYDVPKTGYVEIKRDKSKSAVTLITCKKGTNMQTIYIGYLVSVSKTL